MCIVDGVLRDGDDQYREYETQGKPPQYFGENLSHKNSNTPKKTIPYHLSSYPRFSPSLRIVEWLGLDLDARRIW